MERQNFWLLVWRQYLTLCQKKKSKVKEGIGEKVPVSKMKFCTTLKKFGMSNVAFF